MIPIRIKVAVSTVMILTGHRAGSMDFGPGEGSTKPDRTEKRNESQSLLFDIPSKESDLRATGLPPALYRKGNRSGIRTGALSRSRS